MRITTKIASATGQKWKGVFEKYARRLASGSSRRGDEEEGEEDSGRVTSLSSIHDGYLGRSVRRKDAITTYVVDPPGIYTGVLNAPVEGGMESNSIYFVYSGLPRDNFNPVLPLIELEEVPVADKVRKPTIYAMRLGNSFPEYPWGADGGELAYGSTAFSCSPGEGRGIAVADIASNLRTFSEDGNLTILEGARFASVSCYVLGSAHGYGVTSFDKRTWLWFINEQYIAQIKQDFYMCSRYTKRSSLCRQLPASAAVRDLRRMATAGSVITNPEQIAPDDFDGFPDRGGEPGIFVHVARTPEDPDEEADSLLRVLTLKDMGRGRVEPEEWDRRLPWIQYYMDLSVDPPERVPKVYKPLGGYLIADDPPAISDYMSASLGCPSGCAKDDSFEFLVDFRVARTWIDSRGLDKYPELMPITVQVQTGVLLVTVEGFDDRSFGSLTSKIERLDVSGSFENGSYAALGGSDRDVHRLWRTMWSGNAGGKHAALLSVVRHERFEESAPGADWLKTAQSTYSGDEPPRLADEPVAIQLYVDGVFVERLSSEVGFSFLDLIDEDTLRKDDCAWLSSYRKWGAVAGDELVFFCAYSYPDPTEIVLVRWDLGSGSLSVVRRMPRSLNGTEVRAAVTCYSQQVIRGGVEVSPGCILLRLGAQAGPGWVELTKDYGETWVRVMGSDVEPSFTPGHGLFYSGSELVGVNYGEVFNQEAK